MYVCVYVCVCVCVYGKGCILLMSPTIMNQSREKFLFLTHSICLAETPFKDFLALQQIMFGLIDLLQLCFLDSLNPHFCCQWKQGALILFAFSKKKYVFSTLEIGCRFNYSPNNKSQGNQILEVYGKSLLSSHLQWINLT